MNSDKAWSNDSNPLVPRNKSILEAIEYIKETQNEMIDGCESEGGPGRQCTGSRKLGALKIDSCYLITVIGTVLPSKFAFSLPVLFDGTCYDGRNDLGAL